MCTLMTSKKSTAHPCTHRVGRALLTNDTSKKTTAHPCKHKVGRALRTNDTNYAMMYTMTIYHRNPRPTHANTESTKACMQAPQTNEHEEDKLSTVIVETLPSITGRHLSYPSFQHEEAFCTIWAMRTYHRFPHICPYTDSMSLLHPPTTLLLKAASHVEAFSTNQKYYQALSLCAAVEKITMIQFAASQDQYGTELSF